jgi:hypothetical protein
MTLNDIHRRTGLLAAFPKLIGSSNKQHTFVDTESVRYIYQPLDELYMVIITNKQSNILQDIQTLQLFARTISEYCRSTKEAEIIRNAYEILCAFDEVISLGYRENVTVPQIRTITEMDSHEEKLQEMLQKVSFNFIIFHANRSLLLLVPIEQGTGSHRECKVKGQTAGDAETGKQKGRWRQHDGQFGRFWVLVWLSPVCSFAGSWQTGGSASQY